MGAGNQILLRQVNVATVMVALCCASLGFQELGDSRVGILVQEVSHRKYFILLPRPRLPAVHHSSAT